ncbi:MAG: NAD(P)H-hydrate epimerase [Acidimicrobiales bacterium]
MHVDVVPVISADSIGWLTTEQMVEVDRIMIDELRIDLVQMMENAGRNLARLAIKRFMPNSVVVCAGSGGNGGGGLVGARHLAVAGVDVQVVLATDRDRLRPVPAHQLDIVERMGIPVVGEVAAGVDLVIDAVIGYSLRGDPRGRTADVIGQIDRAPTEVLALDVPSGLDSTTGVHATPHVSADATCTLALPKIGLRNDDVVGHLYVADISVPPSVYEAIGAGPAPDFALGSILRID